MNTQTRTKTAARTHGAWQRATRAWLVAMLLGLLTLAMAAPTLAAQPPHGGTTPGGPQKQPDFCTLNQCIKDVHVEAGGKYVDFLVGTSQLAVATVQISKNAPQQAGGVYTFSGVGTDGFLSLPALYSHAGRISGLEPDTTYHYLVNAAKGAAGGDAQQIGTFKTLKRYVTVKIETITVTDDSDALSAGDLVFNLDVNGSSPAIYPAAETTQWSTGTTRTVNMQVTVPAGPQAKVTLKGWDWDTESPGWLAGEPVQIDQQGFNTGQRADCSQTYTLTGDDEDHGLSGTIFFLTINKSLKYQAHGTYTTTYAP